jgi:hypothetical protein
MSRKVKVWKLAALERKHLCLLKQLYSGIQQEVKSAGYQDCAGNG